MATLCKRCGEETIAGACSVHGYDIEKRTFFKMDFLNKLGLLSFILTIIALYLLGVPNKWCYGFFTVSMVVQGYIFWKTKQWWLVVQMGVLIIFNIINYIRWTSQGIG